MKRDERMNERMNRRTDAQTRKHNAHKWGITWLREILFSGFRGVAMTRTGLTDRQTNRWVKNIIPSATCMGYNN